MATFNVAETDGVGRVAATATALKPEKETVAPDPWSRVEGLPCSLSIEIPVQSFTVSDLFHLCPGRLIASGWIVGQDVPLRINGELVAWSEFEVVQEHLAVRLTELA
jgi:flagellar motor switch protein FliN/FliY